MVELGPTEQVDIASTKVLHITSKNFHDVVAVRCAVVYCIECLLFEARNERTFKYVVSNLFQFGRASDHKDGFSILYVFRVLEIFRYIPFFSLKKNILQ